MRYFPASVAAFSVLITASSFAALPVPPPLPAAQLQAEMAQVPPTDPPMANAPTIVDAMKGVHPRLLFTQAEIDAIKAKVDSDPVLKAAYDQTIEWGTKLTPPLSGPRPEVVAGDDRMGTYFEKAACVAYTYALTKDPQVKKNIIETLTTMANTDHWADANAEVDASMGAAQNMFFTALLYDTVYNDLDPALRTQIAQKLFTMSRRLYYLGHKGLELPFPAKGFWTSDPQPNHRWYRDLGLASCVLSVADEKGIDAAYLMQGLKEEMDFIAKWYPPEGDCHEGAGYQDYGFVPIATACTMMDRNVGTTYLKDTGLKYAWMQHMYYWVPARHGDISFGDDQNGGGTGGIGPGSEAFFLSAKLSGSKDAQGALLFRYDKDTAAKPPSMPWPMLAFYDPSLPRGDMKTIPTYHLFPDLGAASMRDSWDDDAVVFTFKCGPSGGYKLNEYRNTVLQNGHPHYINIAHDDPDANEFAMAVGPGFAFHPGNYTDADPKKTKKLSAEHSTITIDGKGQAGEIGAQPIGFEDMTQFSYLTGWKTDDKGHIIIEGEAGPAYRGQNGPELKAAGNKLAPAVLKTYRRTVIWMPKEYILILDNIVSAGGTHAVTWHGSSVKAAVTNGAGTVTSENGAEVKIQTVSNQNFDTAVADMTLIGRWGSNPIQQIQLTANAEAVKFATVLNPWKTGATVKLTDASGSATVEVTGTGFDDTWTWTPAADLTTPSSVAGKRAGAALISLTTADKAPRP